MNERTYAHNLYFHGIASLSTAESSIWVDGAQTRVTSQAAGVAGSNENDSFTHGEMFKFEFPSSREKVMLFTLNRTNTRILTRSWVQGSDDWLRGRIWIPASHETFNVNKNLIFKSICNKYEKKMIYFFLNSILWHTHAVSRCTHHTHTHFFFLSADIKF